MMYAILGLAMTGALGAGTQPRQEYIGDLNTLNIHLACREADVLRLTQERGAANVAKEEAKAALEISEEAHNRTRTQLDNCNGQFSLLGRTCQAEKLTHQIQITELQQNLDKEKASVLQKQGFMTQDSARHFKPLDKLTKLLIAREKEIKTWKGFWNTSQTAVVTIGKEHDKAKQNASTLQKQLDRLSAERDAAYAERDSVKRELQKLKGNDASSASVSAGIVISVIVVIGGTVSVM